MDKIKLMNRLALYKTLPQPSRKCEIIFQNLSYITLVLSSPQVFGFLASIMFLSDAVFKFLERQQEPQMRKPEATRRAGALTEPLNA